MKMAKKNKKNNTVVICGSAAGIKQALRGLDCRTGESPFQPGFGYIETNKLFVSIAEPGGNYPRLHPAYPLPCGGWEAYCPGEGVWMKSPGLTAQDWDEYFGR